MDPRSHPEAFGTELRPGESPSIILRTAYPSAGRVMIGESSPGPGVLAMKKLTAFVCLMLLTGALVAGADDNPATPSTPSV